MAENNGGVGMAIVAALAATLGKDPTLIGEAVADWLEEHPEATTTVEDGSITYAKLAEAVAAKLDEVDTLSEAIVPLTVTTKTLPVGAYVNDAIAATRGNLLTDRPKRCRNVKPFDKKWKSVSAASGYSFVLCAYTKPTISVDYYVGLWNGSSFVKPNDPIFLTTANNPNDEYYYYLSVKKNDDTNINPATICDKFIYTYDTINNLESEIDNEVYPLGLHTKPESEGVVNAIRRARQVTDIKWTPAATLYRANVVTNVMRMAQHLSFQDQFTQGVEYEGIPYGDTTDMSRQIAVSRPLDVFATSVCNADTVMCSETEYHEKYATYYYNACSGLVCYALNIPTVYAASFINVDGLIEMYNLIIENVRRPLEDLKLCDILRTTSHVAMITDIIKDKNGKVVLIEVSEQTRFGGTNNAVKGAPYGGKARRLTFTPDEFFEWFGSFKVYRYMKLDEIPYKSCPYVPMVDENQRIVEPNFPIVPYLGNRCLVEGTREVTLVISGENYTHVVVKKNGSPWNQDGTTDAYTISGDTLTITCDDENAEYSAYLATYQNGSVYYYTIACEWFVSRGTTVSATISGGKVNFTVSTNNNLFVPWFSNIKYNKSTDGYNHMISSDYTHTQSGGNHVYTFSHTIDEGTPTVYDVGMWSDKYGLVELKGTI